MALQQIPNPGSPDARKQGCSCPQDENQHGKGANIASAKPDKQYFAVDADCELHGFRA